MDSDWRAGIEAEIEAAAEPLWEIAERVFEATGKLVYDAGAREEREAVVRAIKARQLYVIEHFDSHGAKLRCEELDELLRSIEAAEHRKEAAHA